MICECQRMISSLYQSKYETFANVLMYNECCFMYVMYYGQTCEVGYIEMHWQLETRTEHPMEVKGPTTDNDPIHSHNCTHSRFRIKQTYLVTSRPFRRRQLVAEYATTQEVLKS